MARPKQSFQKREKERSRQKKREKKEARRLEAKQRKAEIPSHVLDADPDLAGITPGPQPLPEQWNDVRDPDESTQHHDE